MRPFPTSFSTQRATPQLCAAMFDSLLAQVEVVAYRDAQGQMTYRPMPSDDQDPPRTSVMERRAAQAQSSSGGQAVADNSQGGGQAVAASSMAGSSTDLIRILLQQLYTTSDGQAVAPEVFINSAEAMLDSQIIVETRFRIRTVFRGDQSPHSSFEQEGDRA